MLDAGRALLALEKPVAEFGHRPAPSQAVAKELAKLLPPTNAQSERRGRNGSAELVAEGWSKVVEAHEASDEPEKPITSTFAKKVLVKAGMLPDTSAAAHKPGWHELLGEVGDDLIAAQKHMDRFEQALTRKPNAALQEKAARYEQMAADLLHRLRALRQG